jgi:hypothetical protein
MNTRLKRIHREILTIGMAFVMIAVCSIFPSQHMPVVQAQGGDATFVFSDLQFDGSRYYYPCSVFAGYINVNWRLYLTNNIDYIVNEVALVNVNVDSSVFFEVPAPCSGFGDCATRCNACVSAYQSNCKTIAIAAAVAAGIVFIGSFGCAIGAAATIVGLGVAFLCGAAAGALVTTGGAAIKAQYEICRAAAYGACNAANPGCSCGG